MNRLRSIDSNRNSPLNMNVRDKTSLSLFKLLNGCGTGRSKELILNKITQEIKKQEDAIDVLETRICVQSKMLDNIKEWQMKDLVFMWWKMTRRDYEDMEQYFFVRMNSIISKIKKLEKNKLKKIRKLDLLEEKWKFITWG